MESPNRIAEPKASFDHIAHAEAKHNAIKFTIISTIHQEGEDSHGMNLRAISIPGCNRLNRPRKNALPLS